MMSSARAMDMFPDPGATTIRKSRPHFEMNQVPHYSQVEALTPTVSEGEYTWRQGL